MNNRRIITIFMVLLAALLMALPALADHYAIAVGLSSLECGSGSGTLRISTYGGNPGGTFDAHLENSRTGSGASVSGNLAAGTAVQSFSVGLPAGTLPGDTIYVELNGPSGNATTDPVTYSCGSNTKAPGLWLADVCEPDHGFSSDGWMTWGTDQANTLYAGASSDGPWLATGFNGSTHVMSRQHLADITSMVGLSDSDQVWLMSSESGKPVRIGSEIYDRDVRMDALCGG